MAEYVERSEPAWLSAKVDQRIAFMLEKTGGNFPPEAILATPLTEPEDGQDFDKWDRSCDNCGRYVPEGEPFHSGTCVRFIEAGNRALISFGACDTCWED